MECDVYLSDEAERCSLCGSRAVDMNEPTSSVLPDPPSHITNATIRDGESGLEAAIGQLLPAERRRMTAELLSVTIGSIFIVTTGLDFLFSTALTWSRYTGITLCYIWMLSAFPLLAWNKRLLVALVLSGATIVTVFLWALFTGHLSWFFTLGLPISASLIACVIGPYFLISVQHRKGLNAVGVVLAFSVLFCIAIDAAVHVHLEQRISLSWSIVVCISAIPVAALLFYLHYRVTNRASLRKLFRL